MALSLFSDGQSSFRLPADTMIKSAADHAVAVEPAVCVPVSTAAMRFPSVMDYGSQDPNLVIRGAYSSPVRQFPAADGSDQLLDPRVRRTQAFETAQGSPLGMSDFYAPPLGSNALGAIRSCFPPSKMANLGPAFDMSTGGYYGYSLSMPATLRELTETSIADEWESHTKATDFAVSATAGLTEFSSPSKQTKSEATSSSGFSSEALARDIPSHWIAIRGTSSHEVHNGIVADALRKKSGMFENAIELVVGDALFFEIDTLKTAPFAKAAVTLINPRWSAEYVPKHFLANSLDGMDGQLRVTVILVDGSDPAFDISLPAGTDLVLQCLCRYFEQTWGEIRATQMIHFDLGNRLVAFRMELDSLAVYRNLMKECRGKILNSDGLNFEVDFWQPHNQASFPTDAKTYRSGTGAESEGLIAGNGIWSANCSPVHDGVADRSMGMPNGLGQFQRNMASGFSSPTRRGQSPQGIRAAGAAPQSNSVSKDRILSGQDVRTTIMLRNIPNRIDVHQFKSFLDRTSFGRYDFSYLRIDFQTNSNVGYAFINFVDANNIIPFADAVSGRQWAEWGSQKTAQISYATIQGRDCLIQKFRNSSVMREMPDHRPKLWYSLVSPGIPQSLVGTEEQFPPPDNHAKLQRSIDNAAHQGLYPPRSGDALGEDRSRRGSWDRGTLHELAERLMQFAELKYTRGH